MGVGSEFQILDILQYALGFEIPGSAYILDQNPVFEIPSSEFSFLPPDPKHIVSHVVEKIKCRFPRKGIRSEAIAVHLLQAFSSTVHGVMQHFLKCWDSGGLHSQGAEVATVAGKVY